MDLRAGVVDLKVQSQKSLEKGGEEVLMEKKAIKRVEQRRPEECWVGVEEVEKEDPLDRGVGPFESPEKSSQGRMEGS